MVLYLLWMLGDYQPREYKWIGLGTFLLFNAGSLWMALRARPTVPRERDDEEKRNHD